MTPKKTYQDLAKESTYTFKEDGTLDIVNACIPSGRFRNFAGAPVMIDGELTDIGPQFSVAITEEVYQEGISRGWDKCSGKPHIKFMPARTEEEEPLYFIEVSLNFTPKRKDPRSGEVKIIDAFVPKIHLGTEERGHKTVTELDATSASMLDTMKFEEASLTINPREWTKRTGFGVKFFLKEMFVVGKSYNSGSNYGGRYSDYYTSETASAPIIPDEPDDMPPFD